MSVAFKTYAKLSPGQAQVVNLDQDGKISGSVGAGGVNAPRDVRTVQCLFNGMGPMEGGPSEMLAVDGIAGPITIGTIHLLQSTQFGTSDGRVDPAGRTIKLLREPAALAGPVLGTDLSKSLAPPPSQKKKDPLPPLPRNLNKIEIYAKRLANAVTAFQPARAAVDKVLQRLSFAIPSAARPTLGSGADNTIAFFDKHFHTGTKHSPALASDLKFIEHIYRTMTIVMNARLSFFGGTPWGIFIFDIDRFPNLNKHALAYTGLGAFHIAPSKVDRRFNLPMMGSTIYLCDAADRSTPDEFITTVLHEVAHMVGSTRAGLGIDDFGYGWEVQKYNRNGKFRRMHNAENYAVCAFESMFGTKRLHEQLPNSDFLRVPVVVDGLFKT